MSYPKEETQFIHLSASNGETQSQFEAVCNDQITIKKDSVIGLQSISLNFNADQIFIDNTNSRIAVYQGGTAGINAFGNVDGTSILGLLTEGTYNRKTLAAELQYQLNRTNSFFAVDRNAQGQGSTTPYARTEFIAKINSNDKAEIQFAMAADDNSTATTTSFESVGVNPNGVSGFTKPAPSTDYSYCYYKPIFIRSRGRIAIKYLNNRSGNIIGLLSALPDITTITSLDLDQYFIGVKNNAGTYQYIYNGATFDSTIAAQDNDGVRIDIGEGQFKIGIFRNFSDAIVAGSQKLYLYTKATLPSVLTGCVSILDSTATSTQFIFTPSPFQLSTADGVHLVSDVSELHGPNYISNIGSTPTGTPAIQISLSAGLANVLGFVRTVLTTAGALTQSGSWISDGTMKSIVFPNALMIELVNVPLKSYNTVTRRRQNIIGVVSGLEVTTNTDQYYLNMPEIIYISTHLYADTIINSWQVKITGPDGNLIYIDPGKISINIVVKG